MKKLVLLRVFALTIGCGLVLSLSGCGGRSQGSTYYDCNLSVIDRAQAQQKRCEQTKTRYEQSLCLSENYKYVARNACSVTLINLGKSVGFIYERMALVDSPENAKKVSSAQRDAQYRELDRMANKEIQYSVSNMRTELAERDANRAAARTNALIDSSIYVLGGSVNRTNNNTFIYTYRGKSTSCTTIGNVISCQ